MEFHEAEKEAEDLLRQLEGEAPAPAPVEPALAPIAEDVAATGELPGAAVAVQAVAVPTAAPGGPPLDSNSIRADTIGRSAAAAAAASDQVMREAEALLLSLDNAAAGVSAAAEPSAAQPPPPPPTAVSFAPTTGSGGDVAMMEPSASVSATTASSSLASPVSVGSEASSASGSGKRPPRQATAEELEVEQMLHDMEADKSYKPLPAESPPRALHRKSQPQPAAIEMNTVTLLELADKAAAAVRPADPKRAKDVKEHGSGAKPGVTSADVKLNGGGGRRSSGPPVFPIADERLDWLDTDDFSKKLHGDQAWGPEEKAIRYTHKLKADGAGIELDRTEPCSVRVKPKPMGAGQFRQCWYMMDLTQQLRLILKEPLDPNPALHTRDAYLPDLFTHLMVQKLAYAFQALKPPKTVQFAPVWLYELPNRKSSNRFFAAEAFIKGEFVKFTDNKTFKHADAHHTLSAFSHFTYQHTKQRLLACDLQGVASAGGYFLTDPLLHATDAKLTLAIGNGGDVGMEAFFFTHHCNPLCKFAGATHRPVEPKGAAPDVDKRRRTFADRKYPREILCQRCFQIVAVASDKDQYCAECATRQAQAGLLKAVDPNAVVAVNTAAVKPNDRCCSIQ